MASLHIKSLNIKTAVIRWPETRRRIRLRRRKLPIIRLGGKNPARGVFLKRMVKRIRLRWLKFQYLKALRKIKGFYRDLVKEFVAAGAGLDAIQQRMMIETAAFAMPGLGLSFSSHDRAPC